MCTYVLRCYGLEPMFDTLNYEIAYFLMTAGLCFICYPPANISLWTGIRKFGLEYCDLPTMLWNVAFLLRPLTLNIDSRHKKPIPLLFYVLTVVITSSYFYVYLISMSWFVFVRSLETKELIPAMVVLSLGISSEIGTLKFLYTFVYIDKVRKIVDEYLECDALVTPGSRLSKNLLKTLRFVKRRAIIYWLVIIGNGFAYWSKPLFMKGRHHLEDNLVIYGLEPMLESPNYEMAYFLMTAGVCFICYPPANVTILLIVVVGYTEAQMLALSEEILNLWDDANEHYNSLPSTNQNNNEIKSKIINKYVKERLKDITTGHARNINLLQQVEFVFRGAIAIGYVFLILGLIAELLGGLENTFLQIPFAFIQVAIDCFTGQRVMDANIVFERAVYDCKWENFDKTNMKTVLLLLQNSQKTLTLSAGGVTMLNFRCLMSIIKSIYSAYTTLRTTMN